MPRAKIYTQLLVEVPLLHFQPPVTIVQVYKSTSLKRHQDSSKSNTIMNIPSVDHW